MNYYTKKLSLISDKINLPLTSVKYCKNIHWVYGVVIKDNIKLNASKAIQILKKNGIDCRPFFYPMHVQPIYKKMKIFDKTKFPISEKISKKGFYIPSGLGITLREQDIVINKIIKIFNNKKLSSN